MCVVGPDSQRNSPHVPTLLLSLASGSVLTHEQSRVLTQPSAFLIEICLLILSVILSGLHSRAGLVVSVKLGCEWLRSLSCTHSARKFLKVQGFHVEEHPSHTGQARVGNIFGCHLSRTP